MSDKPTYEELESMYFAQCACTDEWAEKARKKSDEALLQRIADLQGLLGQANAIITERNVTEQQLRTQLAEARKDAEEAAIVRSDLVAALNLGLEYWRHRQQRYKNRHPIWVEAATKAIDRALIDKEQKSGKD